MVELEEREGADFGAQYLFAASSTERLHSEDEVEDGAQLFLSSLEDERLLALLPDPVRMLVNPVTLVDVVLDLDRPPVVHERSLQGKLSRRILHSCPILRQQDLDSVYRHELLSGRWTPDDRSGISGTLHRVSRLLDPYDGGSLIGLTLRMAHPIYGLTRAAPQLQRVIEAGRSLLVLGPPGCGKTTLLREIARVLDAELNRRVFLVDTSSEICGFGRSAHLAVGGTTRRMQVANRKEQHEDMLKAVQNHTPEVLVIDEIGSQEEVNAAGLIGFKGVSLVATAHANSLQEAMKNPGLQPLFGGLEKSTVSDQTAQRSGGRKFVEQRRTEPVFQSLVEVGPETWVVHEVLADSVDQILAKQPPRTSWVQAPCSPVPVVEQRSGVRLSRQAQPNDAGARPAVASTAPRRSLTTEEIEARRSRREREVSGRAYRLRFDGGVDGGDNGPGGAGAILERLRPVTGRAERRSAKKWMLYVPKSCPELMEYAGLFIGLCGVKEVLEDLEPQADVLFVEGDCKFVVDRHCVGAGLDARGADGLHEEHPAVAEKLEQLACRVDEVLHALRRQLLVEVRWRRRARNKAADKLTHEARMHKQSTTVVNDEMAVLLRPFDTELVPTLWHIDAAHPMLCATEGHHVRHPRQKFGWVGLQLKHASADGSCSLAVRLEGHWQSRDSFLLGLVPRPQNQVDFSRAGNFLAQDVGFWFSPRSGTVCGSYTSKDGTVRRAAFILPSLRVASDLRAGSRSRIGLRDVERNWLSSSARWAMTLRRGRLEFWFARGDNGLESLGHVCWPWGDTLPEGQYSAAVLFKPRKTLRYPALRDGGARHLVAAPSHNAGKVKGKGKGHGKSPPKRPCTVSASLVLLGHFEGAFASPGWQDLPANPKPDLVDPTMGAVLNHLRTCCSKPDSPTEGQLRYLADCIVARSEFRGDPLFSDARNFLSAPNAVARLVEWTRPGTLPNSPFQTERSSPGIRMDGRLLYHPQQDNGVEFVQFADRQMLLGVRCHGNWERRDGFLLGVTPADCDFEGSSWLSNLGYFFSPRSRSIIGRSGVNFSWPDTLHGVWLKQLQENGYQHGDSSRVEGGLRLVHGAGDEAAAWGLRFSEAGRLEVFYKPCKWYQQQHQPHLESNMWLKLGELPWDPWVNFSGHDWRLTIVFKPRHGSKCTANLSPKGGRGGKSRGRGGKRGKIPNRLQDPPYLEILETCDDHLLGCPAFIGGRCQWKGKGPPLFLADFIEKLECWEEEFFYRRLAHPNGGG
ncbi:ycf45 [Symbiodinium sp. CCMP2592]|nr:ycf45 [Symbiodinium sp. CCMP2592]